MREVSDYIRESLPGKTLLAAGVILLVGAVALFSDVATIATWLKPQHDAGKVIQTNGPQQGQTPSQPPPTVTVGGPADTTPNKLDTPLQPTSDPMPPSGQKTLPAPLKVDVAAAPQGPYQAPQDSSTPLELPNVPR